MSTYLIVSRPFVFVSRLSFRRLILTSPEWLFIILIAPVTRRLLLVVAFCWPRDSLKTLIGSSCLSNRAFHLSSSILPRLSPIFIWISSAPPIPLLRWDSRATMSLDPLSMAILSLKSSSSPRIINLFFTLFYPSSSHDLYCILLDTSYLFIYPPFRSFLSIPPVIVVFPPFLVPSIILVRINS